MNILKSYCGFLAVVLSAAFVGCAEQPTPVPETPPATVEHDHNHEHGHEGPHGGHLIELGRDHQYHAEMVEDHQAEQLTIHILDDKMQPLAIEAESIDLNLSVEGEPRSFQLAAADAVDGKASRFVSADASPLETLEEHAEVAGNLQVMIAGSPYTGAVEHHEHHDHEGHDDESHDHEGHDHTGHDHEGHDHANSNRG